MTRRRTAEAIGIFLSGVAIGLLPFGWVRVPIAALCLACLIFFASAIAAHSTVTRRIKP